MASAALASDVRKWDGWKYALYKLGGDNSSSPQIIDDRLVSDALSSGMLFARKFDYENYPTAVNEVLEAV